jgi:hypothetical protein
MNYELAKQLKDARFPLDPFRDWSKSDFAWLPCSEITKEEREKLWIPTLSELIKACGDEFLRLQLRETGNWVVFSRTNGVLLPFFTTPEEAVANLWLALNESAL